MFDKHMGKLTFEAMPPTIHSANPDDAIIRIAAALASRSSNNEFLDQELDKAEIARAIKEFRRQASTGSKYVNQVLAKQKKLTNEMETGARDLNAICKILELSSDEFDRALADLKFYRAMRTLLQLTYYSAQLSTLLEHGDAIFRGMKQEVDVKEAAERRRQNQARKLRDNAIRDRYTNMRTQNPRLSARKKGLGKDFANANSPGFSQRKQLKSKKVRHA